MVGKKWIGRKAMEKMSRGMVSETEREREGGQQGG